MSAGPRLLMIIDPATLEAYRKGEGPLESGPLFFTSREKLEEYARAEGIRDYTVHEVPGAILTHMNGKPHWVDGVERK